MNREESEKLMRRLSCLEKENRRVRLVAFPAAIIAAAVVLSGGMAASSAQQSGSERLLEAERFVLKDKQGRVRAWLGIDDNDNATLRLIDKTGDSMVAVTAATNTCGIGLFPARGPVALISSQPDGAFLSFRPRGTFGWLLAGAEGANGANAKTPPGDDHKSEIGLSRGHPYVTLGDKNGPRGEWLVDEAGNTVIRLRDKAGNIRAELAVAHEKGTSLRLFDKDGVTRGTWGLAPDGKFMLLAMNDKAGTARAMWYVYRDGTASIVFVDRGGNATFSAP